MCITRSLCGPGTLIYFFGPFSESMICCLESMRAQPRRAPRSSLTTLGGHCPELFHSMTSWYFPHFLFSPQSKHCSFHTTSVPKSRVKQRTKRVRKQWLKQHQQQNSFQPGSKKDMLMGCRGLGRRKWSREEERFLALSLGFRRLLLLSLKAFLSGLCLHLHPPRGLGCLTPVRIAMRYQERENGKTHHQLSVPLNYGLLSQSSCCCFIWL